MAIQYTNEALLDSIAKHGWEIGAFSYGVPHVTTWGADARLIIGRYCSIAREVRIYLGGDHRTDWVTTYPFSVLRPSAAQFEGHPATKGDVVIGNDVWIGRDALILSGVRIGDGACIGAGAVVAKDVAPYAIVGGNPAKLIRMRFSEGQIQRLLRIAWWAWDDQRVDDNMNLLLSEDIDAFIEANDPQR